MSKMNAFRIINLNYNNNGIRIDDEIFQLNGESTLLSLRNGGGKSVLVQMLTAPFVHKRFRDVKERPFASYFTTNKPTFILIEWILDGGVGYVLTGMMVRKRQIESEEDSEKDELEVIQFIHEYLERNECDIYHIPLLTEGEGGKALKGFHACTNLFESYKNDRLKKFFVYDMSVPNQGKNYFNKLEEYQIFSKEWESIIKKVNLKESGLSELFADAKDEKGLVDKWFLDAVESKLNKEESRMKEFEKIIEKFMVQYRENKANIDKKEVMKNFKEESTLLFNAAKDYSDVMTQKTDTMNKIANLSKLLEDLKTSLYNKKEIHEHHIVNLKEEEKDILHEEYSYHIYQLSDQKAQIESKQKSLNDRITTIQTERERTWRQKNILELAKIYENYKEESKEVQLLEHKLDLITKEEKDLSSERQQLGYTLRCHYEEEEKSQIELMKKYEDNLSSNRLLVEELKLRIGEKEKEQKDKIAQTGSLSEKIKNYNKEEQEYNERFKESLGRNILGEYEPGTIDIKRKEEEDRLSNSKRALIQLKKQKEEKKEEAHSLSRQFEDNRTSIGTIQAQIKNLESLELDFEKQLTLRKTIIQHIGFKENQVFQFHDITKAFDIKINEIEEQLRHQYNLEEQLTKEYKKLEGGKVLELPKDFEEELQNKGIPVTYGMEWLKKNGKSTMENQKILSSNPFLPYGIIMSEQDMNRLLQKELGIFTSFPIPIIRRESLSLQKDKNSTIENISDNVSFYILFNDNLLDEEGLKSLLNKKSVEINDVKADISRREDEKTFYKERVDQLIAQSITYEKYHGCKKNLDHARREEKEADEKERTLRTKIQQLEELRVKTEEQIGKETDTIRILVEKVSELSKLQESYDEYILNIKMEAKLLSELQAIEEAIHTHKESISDIEIENTDTLAARQRTQIQQNEIHDKLKKYIIYDPCELLTRDIEDIKARFHAITQEISVKEKDMEEQLEKAKNRFERLEKDLILQSEHRDLKQEDYEQVMYDHFVYAELEKVSKVKEEEIAKINGDIFQFHGEEASLKVQISEKQKQMQEKLGKIDLKPRENIIATDFKNLIAGIRHKIQKEIESVEEISMKLASYEENSNILLEYNEFTPQVEVLTKEWLMELDKEALKTYIADIRKEYRSIENEEREKKESLNKVAVAICELDQFQDDFFRKPLLTIRGLTNTPEDLIIQLNTTLEAYDQILEKLEIDIAIIHKEKEKILDMLLGYIEDIHNNLGKIDKNSTIKVRDRSIKMLRIILPDWNEEVSAYRIRIRDYIDELIQSGMLRLENNENIEELIGTQITTKKLYDTVVGIGNIEIKLYKIEEQREYPITWAEVAKNSGGEGFLSAFVVLSSLLSFMRRDDTDIFSERIQGKVLVMDNPFAQTNAAHLLKPLMDTAKKSNTQLICLSGLGGDSIYNRFDNIYVLNLVASGLRKGMEYLKSDHIKGEEEVQMITASLIRTEDMEQIEMIF